MLIFFRFMLNIECMFVLNVVVKPGSKIDKISAQADGSLHIKVKSPAIEGKANEYLVRYIAEVFNVKRFQVHLLKGHKSKYKKIRIDAEAVPILEKISQMKS